jgi:hypothetical protein
MERRPQRYKSVADVQELSIEGGGNGIDASTILSGTEELC